MKPIIPIAILFSLHFFNVNGQSQIRLTNDPAQSFIGYNNQRALDAQGDTLHLVWTDFRDGNFEIYYKRSLDNGLSWSPDTRITNSPESSTLPSITASGSDVYIFWNDSLSSGREIFYCKSTNGGTSFGSAIQLSLSSWEATIPCSFAEGQNVHVVWSDTRNGNREIYYKRTSSGGPPWSSDIRLSNNTALSTNPSVVSSGQNVFVFWHDNRDGNFEIYFLRSVDGGSTWGFETRLTNNSASSFVPSCAYANGILHVVWEDNRNPNFAIFYKKSTDNGLTWSNDTVVSNSPASAGFPCLVASGNDIVVTWEDLRGFSQDIFYNSSIDGGTTWATSDKRISCDPAVSRRPLIAVSDTSWHIVWEDHRDGNPELYYSNASQPCSLVSSEEIKNLPNIEIIPNPAADQFRLKSNLYDFGIVRLSIYNVTGQLVLEKELRTDNSTVGTEKLEPGIYFVHVDADKFYAKKMLLIQR